MMHPDVVLDTTMVQNYASFFTFTLLTTPLGTYHYRTLHRPRTEDLQ